jgi:murein DD-endopeptidase MepM/ murein hydrolase activator NlpD
MPVRGSVGGKPLKFFRWRNGARALTAIPVDQPLGALAVIVEMTDSGHRDAGRAPGRAVDAGRPLLDGGSRDAGPPWTDAGSALLDGGRADGGLAAPDAGAADAGAPEGIAWALDADLTGSLDVVEPGWPARELTLASKFLHPPKSALEHIREDNKAIRDAYRQPFRPPAFAHNFVWPRSAEITSHFGDRRLLNGQQQSQHLGTDLEGRVGDPILATNDGTVTLARECYHSGNTIFIYHGAGLFSAYFHMSRMDVDVGAKVKRGQKIGLVGKTGRVTGPHLHFAFKLNGSYINPESMLSLDFESP